MNIPNSHFKLISSLEKVFFEYPHEAKEYACGSMLKNEIYSFQLAGVIREEDDLPFAVRFEVKSDIKDYITMYRIGYVPSRLPSFPYQFSDNDYITKTPGFFPDVMNVMKDTTIKVYSGEIINLWFVVEPKSEVCGCHDITVLVYDDADAEIAELTHTVSIIDMELPKQTLINTSWLHGDCIAKLHNTDIGSDRYYEVLEKYLEIYTKFGHNMILTPIFTPPIDTEIGAERPTNQLVDVTVLDGEYSFSFDKLDKWIDICKKRRIEYFEMSHLFTQWGAKHAPKIMAVVNGEYKRIFGWDTEALSEEYILFLNAFLPELAAFLKSKEIYKNCFFHISDEPNEKYAEQYEKVSNI